MHRVQERYVSNLTKETMALVLAGGEAADCMS